MPSDKPAKGGKPRKEPRADGVVAKVVGKALAKIMGRNTW